MENFIKDQSSGEADESFNNNLEVITVENGNESIEIKKGDTFKSKTPDAVPFKVRRIERINKDEIYFYFDTQNSDGTWPIEENISEKIESKNIIGYLSSAEKIS